MNVLIQAPGGTEIAIFAGFATLLAGLTAYVVADARKWKQIVPNLRIMRHTDPEVPIAAIAYFEHQIPVIGSLGYAPDAVAPEVCRLSPHPLMTCWSMPFESDDKVHSLILSWIQIRGRSPIHTFELNACDSAARLYCTSNLPFFPESSRSADFATFNIVKDVFFLAQVHHVRLDQLGVTPVASSIPTRMRAVEARKQSITDLANEGRAEISSDRERYRSTWSAVARDVPRTLWRCVRPANTLHTQELALLRLGFSKSQIKGAVQASL